MSELIFNKVCAAVINLINNPNNGEMGFLKQRFLNHLDVGAQDVEVTFDYDDMGKVEASISTTMYDDHPEGNATLHHNFSFDTTEEAKQEFLTALTNAVKYLLVQNGPRPDIPFLKVVECEGRTVDQYIYSNFGVVMTPDLEQLHVQESALGGVAANDD